MIKVLHILNSLLPSGAETMLSCSAHYWDKNIEKHILVTNENRGTYAETLEKAGYIIHQICFKNYFRQHIAVLKFIHANEFNTVHIHRQGEACSYAIDAKIAGTKRIIRTVHNVFVFHGLVQIREFIARQIAVIIGSKHVAISPSVKENEWNRFRIKCTEIDNWFDSDRFFYTDEIAKAEARQKLKLDKNKFYIVSVGNCTPVKNHMSILKTLAKHKGDRAFQDVMYLHVGKGVQENEEKDFVKKNGLEERVTFFGFDDPILYLQAADLFVMPSLYEGFGISGIEGLATGIRAIFTDVPGLKDFKNTKFENLVFAPLSDEGIEKCIYEEITHRQIEKSQKQAHEISSLFGIQRGVELYERVYFDN